MMFWLNHLSLLVAGLTPGVRIGRRFSAKRYFRRYSIKLQIELLEARLAPATLVNPSTVTYQDPGGDEVTVSVSKPVFNSNFINDVFLFNTGSINGDNTIKQQLEEINLTFIPAVAGATLKVTAVNAKKEKRSGPVLTAFLFR